jgi:hypothetical protein
MHPYAGETTSASAATRDAFEMTLVVEALIQQTDSRHLSRPPGAKRQPGRTSPDLTCYPKDPRWRTRRPGVNLQSVPETYITLASKSQDYR